MLILHVKLFISQEIYKNVDIAHQYSLYFLQNFSFKCQIFCVMTISIITIFQISPLITF